LAGYADHERKIGRVPLAVIVHGTMKGQLVRSAIQKADAITAVVDRQQALIGILCLRA
jgi:hypothetical protein